MTAPRNATADIGGYRTYEYRGVKYPSVTSILKLGRPMEWMGAWAAKHTATTAVEGLLDGETIDVWEDLDRQAHESTKTHQERHKNKCPYKPSAIGYLKNAPWRKRDDAADFGTDRHDTLEALSLGEELPADAPGREYIIAWRDAYRPRFLETEFQVVSTKHGYAGTGDLIADIYGRKVLLDLKTSSLYDSQKRRIPPHRDWSLQLAAYRYADRIFLDDESWTMPPIDDCATLWIPRDSPAEWQFLQMPANGPELAAFLAAKATHDDHLAHKKESGATLILPQAASVDEVSLRPQLTLVKG